MKDIKVSICCITYNHEDYIEDAIKSFINQRTNFKYEIIIQDDASIDATPDIINEYQNRYPNIIKPIYRKENLGSKSLSAVLENVFKAAKGKYIAVCEGDDYWIDENKLQKQFDYLEKHNDVSLCFHNANYLMMNSNQVINNDKINIFGKYKTNNNYYNAGNINQCELLAKHAVPTASLFFRRKYVFNLPTYYTKAPCADLPLKLYLGSVGKCFYDTSSMAVYRKNTQISIMNKWGKDGEKRKLKRTLCFLKMIRDFNNATENRYAGEMYIYKQKFILEQLMRQKKFKIILNNKKLFNLYKQYYSNDCFGVKLFMKVYFKKIYLYYRIRKECDKNNGN